MTHRTRILAWSLTILGLFLFVALLVFLLVVGTDAVGEVAWGSPGWLGNFFASLPIVTFLAVGGLLALRRPENCVGWLCLAIAWLWLVDGTISTVAEWALYEGRRGVFVWFKALGLLWVFALALTATHLLLRLPDGQLPSPRWRWYSWFCTAVLILNYVFEVTLPGPLVPGLPGTENPLGSEVVHQLLSPLPLFFLLTFFGAAASVVLRYRRAGGVERIQLRWLAYAGVLLVVVFAIALLLMATVAPVGSQLFRLLGDLTFVAFAAIPAAIGIAVLRYRLYDIDILINRTLVYVPLTIILAAIFSLAQQALSWLLTSYGGQNTALSTVLTTLIIVAIFEPLKKRIESLVDKYTKKIPDPAHTVKAFREKVQSRVLRVNTETITQQLLEEVVLGFGATSGAVYLEGNPEQPVHTTRNWNGTARLTIPLRSAEERTALGQLALGPSRTGGDYNDHQRSLLQEMAQITATAIEQDQPVVSPA